MATNKVPFPGNLTSITLFGTEIPVHATVEASGRAVEAEIETESDWDREATGPEGEVIDGLELAADEAPVFETTVMAPVRVLVTVPARVVPVRFSVAVRVLVRDLVAGRVVVAGGSTTSPFPSGPVTKSCLYVCVSSSAYIAVVG